MVDSYLDKPRSSSLSNELLDALVNECRTKAMTLYLRGLTK